MMSQMTIPLPVLDAAAREFLKRNDAEKEFQTVCALVRECFPQLLKLEAELKDDHDEPGRQLLVVYAHVSESGYGPEYREQVVRYHDRFVDEVPLSKVPLFVMQNRFVQEE
jgi:hypothetical protein